MEKYIDTQTIYEDLSKTIQSLKAIAKRNYLNGEENSSIINDIVVLSDLRLKYIPNTWSNE